ncbi:unnamed protein product [Trichogramma brassicae]|uniref:Uncharacterized protein n=1 Tax=Trichogramma brassicae TaxID=86971 RepID=A0A6H5IDP9_9HYME|nr:unnamed protein product [Trichogramma brassicae]
MKELEETNCEILLDLNNRSYPRPMSQCRDKTREIHEIAFTKTRETCLKNDESNDDDVDEVNIKVNRNDDDGEESELTLNLSSSDGSGTEKKRLNYILNQRNDEEESGLGKETSSLVERLAESKDSEHPAKPIADENKKEKLEESDDEEHEDVLPKTRLTRASHDKDAGAKPSSRKGRTGSVAKEIVEDVQPTRRTRATSVVKDEINEQQSNVITKKRTRAASIAKEVSEDKSKIKKSTRATSLNKEISQINETQKNTRTRGQSLPKDIVQPQDFFRRFAMKRTSHPKK